MSPLQAETGVENNTKEEKLKWMAGLFDGGAIGHVLTMPGTNRDTAFKSALGGDGVRFVIRRHILSATWSIGNSYLMLSNAPAAVGECLRKAAEFIGTRRDEEDKITQMPEEVSHVAVALPYEQSTQGFCRTVKNLVEWAAMDPRIVRLTIHQDHGQARAHYKELVTMMEDAQIDRDLSLQFEVLVVDDSEKTLQVVFTDRYSPPVEVPSLFLTFDGSTNGFPIHILHNVDIIVKQPACFTLQGPCPTREKWQEALTSAM